AAPARGAVALITRWTASTSSRSAGPARTRDGVEAPPVALDESPPIKEWARSQGIDMPARGRPSNDIRRAYDEAKSAWEQGLDPTNTLTASSGMPTSGRSRSEGRRKAYQGNSTDVEQELARVAAESARTAPAEVPASAPTRQASAARGEALNAQEIKFRPGMGGTSIEPCPSCGERIHDRIFPVGEPGTNKYALVHARCPSGGDQQMMEAIPDAS